MPNDKHKFVPCDQVSPLINCCLLFIISTHKLIVSCNFMSKRIALNHFFLLIFYFEKFSPWIWRLLWSLNSPLLTFWLDTKRHGQPKISSANQPAGNSPNLFWALSKKSQIMQFKIIVKEGTVRVTSLSKFSYCFVLEILSIIV